VTAFSVLSLCADFIYKLEKLYDEVKKNDRNPDSGICSAMCIYSDCGRASKTLLTFPSTRLAYFQLGVLGLLKFGL